MDQQDWPITGVVVVADITKCPAGYTTIDRTFDRSEEADLWRDGWLGRRVTRYMCVERSAPAPGRDVLVDVSIIADKDPVPAGFTVVENTVDTREKAIKRKVLCVRWMSVNLTNSAISELIILSKGTRRPPNGYTMVGELNNLMLCYKMAPIKTQSSMVNSNSDPTMNMSQLTNNLPYSITPKMENSYHQGSPAGYSTTPGEGQTNSHPNRGPPERQMSILSSTVAPLTGIQWQLNPRLKDLSSLQNLQIPEIRYKSIMDIEKEYEYRFEVEGNVKASY